jgi:hypothetical protein
MVFQSSVFETRQKIDGFHLGHLEVKAGQICKVDGFVFGSITIRAGAKIKVDGFVFGNVINFGGEFTINGFLFGRQIDSEPGDDLRVINPTSALPKPQATASLSRRITGK